jgi:hypothetical protein
MREGVRRKGAGGDRAAGLPRLGFQPVSPFRWICVRDFCSFKTSDLPLNRTCSGLKFCWGIPFGYLKLGGLIHVVIIIIIIVIIVIIITSIIIITIIIIDFIFEIYDLYDFGLGFISSLPQFIWDALLLLLL